MWVTNNLVVPTDFHNVGKIPWKSMGNRYCLVTHIFQNIIFCVQQKNKLIQVCNNLRMSKLWQNFYFGWTNPLTAHCCLSHGRCNIPHKLKVFHFGVIALVTFIFHFHSKASFMPSFHFSFPFREKEWGSLKLIQIRKTWFAWRLPATKSCDMFL